METSRQSTLLAVPGDAVVLIQGQPTVFVREGNAFRPRTVQLGDRRADQVEIRKGIKSGEQIVVAGTFALKARLLKDQIGDAH